MCAIVVGRRRRFAILSFTAAAAAAVAGNDGRRLSAELWVGTSMYIRICILLLTAAATAVAVRR